MICIICILRTQYIYTFRFRNSDLSPFSGTIRTGYTFSEPIIKDFPAPVIVIFCVFRAHFSRFCVFRTINNAFSVSPATLMGCPIEGRLIGGDYYSYCSCSLHTLSSIVQKVTFLGRNTRIKYMTIWG